MGQEQDGSLIASWVSIHGEISNAKSHIGIYNPNEKSFSVLHTFPEKENIIQASVNRSRTLLVYVLKNLQENDKNQGNESIFIYKPYIVEVKNNVKKSLPHFLLSEEKCKQIMVQFLWRKQSTFEKSYQDKLLVLIHEESKCFQCKFNFADVLNLSLYFYFNVANQMLL